MSNKSVCIIPARGGSKRIHKKNIKLFAGIPIISWSIRCALETKLFERIIVSTDCHEIADIALVEGEIHLYVHLIWLTIIATRCLL